MPVAPSELVARIVATTAEAADSRAARQRVLETLRRVVPFDSYAWLLTDPETLVGTSPLAEVPRLEDLPTLIRLRYQAPESWRGLHPVTTGPGPSPWRDLLDGYGVRDVASLVFADRFGCWAFLDLWRDRTFTDAEVALLGAFVPTVTAILRAREAQALAMAAHEPTAEGPAVLVLSPTLEVRNRTPEGDAVLRRLLPAESGREPVPAGAYNVAAQLLATETGVDDHPAWARVHVGGGRWLTFRAARLAGQEREDQDIAVSIEPTVPGERLPLFARAHGLSDRETEVLVALAAGGDTRTVAERLFVSEYTVQDHLKAITAKTGLRGRRTLLARATGS